jgi:hypothetical protein
LPLGSSTRKYAELMLLACGAHVASTAKLRLAESAGRLTDMFTKRTHVANDQSVYLSAKPVLPPNLL